MSDAFRPPAGLEGDATSEQAPLDSQSYWPNQDDFPGEYWSNDQNFDRSHAGNNHSESEATGQDLPRQLPSSIINGAHSFDYTFPSESAVEGGPASMDAGFHAAFGIPDGPTIDTAYLPAVPGENSSAMVPSEKFGRLPANELYSRGRLGDMPFQVDHTTGVAPPALLDMSVYMYSPAIEPDYSAKITRGEVLKWIDANVSLWEHPDLGFQCRICVGELGYSCTEGIRPIWLDGLTRWDDERMLLG
ncbi:uncharacterized protein LMH87_008391 [Akanthomyces muscarius]|uniref:Uncharacterized protein n=1 Tax=Akanthomyces muscarius TaxID=2231603 RepID=A0A9W8QKB8_AKAMU|nr:uncharacterized protein LMH87_008391 [Akanthomyces muscarius]KAJ4159491.1 hypothetical protein LMH87_008391 [Akanthomyces muscarius]